MRVNNLLKQNMDGIREEIGTFTLNQGKLNKMCSKEVGELLKNIESLSSKMRAANEKGAD